MSMEGKTLKEERFQPRQLVICRFSSARRATAWAADVRDVGKNIQMGAMSVGSDQYSTVVIAIMIDGANRI